MRNVLDNSFRPFLQPKGICNMSADYSGDHSNELTSAILGSVTQLGSAAIISQGSSNLSAPIYSRPVTTSILPLQNNSGMMSILVIVVLALVGFFAFKKLA